MNFLGHACLAGEQRRDASFVFGAMLPDLAAMAGLRVASVAHAAADDGWRFHGETDAAFHGAAHFQALAGAAARALSGAGVRRGPARALGHVGIELLLDGWLVEEQGVPAHYAEALALAPVLAPRIAFRLGGEAGPLLALCERVAATPVAAAAGSEPALLGARLARILARRPRLALLPSELPAVHAWAAGARGEVARAAPALLAELRRASTGFRSGRAQSAAPARSPRASAGAGP